MKLHIGCGKRYLPGWIHSDIQAYPHIDIVCPIQELRTHIAPGSVDEIYACHVVEHVGRHEIKGTLIVLHDLLKPGSGVLRLSVPDLEAAIRLYNEGVPLFPTLYGQFWGGQKNDHDYHMVGFDLKTLQRMLEDVGFTEIRRYNWRTFLPDGFDDYSRSYLPHMDFENGTLLSLNISAVRQAKPPSYADSQPIVVFCTGGMCNALNALVSASHLAVKTHRKLWVHWVEGYIANDCALTDLLEVYAPNRVQLLDATQYATVVSQKDPLPIVISQDHCIPPELSGMPRAGSATSAKYVDLCSFIQTHANRPFVYHCSIILPCIPDVTACLKDFFTCFRIRSELLHAAKSFLNEKGPRWPIAVHLRGSDILSMSKYTPEDVKNYVRATLNEYPSEKILICSDDRALEEQATQIDPTRVIHRKKRAYVVQRDSHLAWDHHEGDNHLNSATITYQDKTYKNYSSTNVVRTKEQVIDGFIDLLLLSLTPNTIGFYTSRNSTYYQMALHLKGAWKAMPELLGGG